MEPFVTAVVASAVGMSLAISPAESATSGLITPESVTSEPRAVVTVTVAERPSLATLLIFIFPVGVPRANISHFFTSPTDGEGSVIEKTVFTATAGGVPVAAIVSAPREL